VTAQRERSLLLIGLRGSGKTTIGRELARVQQRTFLDLDDATPAFLACSGVREAWDRFGEPAFREAEARALRAALNLSGAVVALGGGTPTAPGAAEQIAHALDDGDAVSAYLRCAPAVLRQRLAGAFDDALADRPSLTGAGTLEEIEAVFEARDALYCTLATRIIEGIVTMEDALAALDDWPRW
jgi:shikimate kinase